MIRSLMFIPGSNEKLLSKGLDAGADALIFDLEDSVSPDQKAQARIMVKDTLLKNPTQKTVVRINAIGTDFWTEDLKVTLEGNPDAVMLPKAGTPEDIKTLVEAIDSIKVEKGLEGDGNNPEIIPLIETALGLENAYSIATSSDRISGMLLGGEDLTADLGCKRTREGYEIFYARSRMVACGRAAGVEIYDTPFTDTRDEEGIQIDAQTAKSLGFSGKACITPRHIDVINEAFSPTQADIEYAKAVIEAIEEAEREGRGVVALNGKMIDAPVVSRAKQVLEAAEAIGLL